MWDTGIHSECQSGWLCLGVEPLHSAWVSPCWNAVSCRRGGTVGVLCVSVCVCGWQLTSRCVQALRAKGLFCIIGFPFHSTFVAHCPMPLFFLSQSSNLKLLLSGLIFYELPFWLNICISIFWLLSTAGTGEIFFFLLWHVFMMNEQSKSVYFLWYFISFTHSLSLVTNPSFKGMLITSVRYLSCVCSNQALTEAIVRSQWTTDWQTESGLMNGGIWIM